MTFLIQSGQDPVSVGEECLTCIIVGRKRPEVKERGLVMLLGAGIEWW